MFVVRATSLSSCQVIANNRKAILRFRSLRDTLTFAVAVQTIKISTAMNLTGSSPLSFASLSSRKLDDAFVNTTNEKDRLRGLVILWCGRKDLNLHESPHQNLNLARLPIPPRPHYVKTALLIDMCGGFI